MFEAVRKNKRISQVILAIIILPFAFFGMDSYFSDNPATVEVATVGGTPITAFEFDQALREQQDRIRQSSGGQIDQAVFESEPFRRAVLENAISQRLLALYAAEHRFTVTPQQLQSVIASMEAFQENGQFSLSRYDALLRSQGMSPAMFEARLAQDLRQQQVMQAISGSALVGQTSAARFLEAQLEERVVRELRFSPDAFAQQASVDDVQVKAFYEANPGRFELPARVKVEYLVFDEAGLIDPSKVSEAAVEQVYQADVGRFGQPEERRARHILLELAADADEAQQQEVRTRAEALLAQLREDPAQFEALAREQSQDPGSARNGGDLGFFAPGMMVKPFEDAVFGLAENEISDLVRTDFGYHIIQLTAIKPSSIRPLEEVRDEITLEIARQDARREYALQAEHFANTVYEQPDTFAPIAEELGLQVATSDWISAQDGELAGVRNEKLMASLFTREALEQRHNVEAVEVAPGRMISARVVEHEPPHRQPFEEVETVIRDELLQQAAVTMARERGEAVLAQLEKGEAIEESWGDEVTLTRLEAMQARPDAGAVFTASSTSLPTHVGAQAIDGSFVVFRLERVVRPELAADDPRVEAVAQQYGQIVGQREFAAFMSAQRSAREVQVRAAALQAEPR